MLERTLMCIFLREMSNAERGSTPPYDACRHGYDIDKDPVYIFADSFTSLEEMCMSLYK